MSIFSKTIKSLPTDGRNIVDLVTEDLQERSEFGKIKYGKYLKPNNGRNALLDAYHESLDLCMYLRQRLEEESLNNS